MTQCCNNIVISWLYRTCWNNLATSLIMPSSLIQVVHSWQLVPNMLQQLGTSSANTTCRQLVGRLATRCETFPCLGERLEPKQNLPIRFSFLKALLSIHLYSTYRYFFMLGQASSLNSSVVTSISQFSRPSHVRFTWHKADGSKQL
jgi:hypothetical protein